MKMILFRAAGVFFGTLLLMIIPVISQAQAPPPSRDQIPIDGGVSVLLAAGAAFGARKVYQHYKGQPPAEE